MKRERKTYQSRTIVPAESTKQTVKMPGMLLNRTRKVPGGAPARAAFYIYKKKNKKFSFFVYR